MSSSLGFLCTGCAIWAYEGWTGNFYPAGTPKDSRLRAYAERLTTVEGNTTFYAIPSAQTAARWAADTPDHFRFCLKFPKIISHERRLIEADPPNQAFLKATNALGTRRGPLMLQLPPSFGPRALPDLRRFLDGLPQGLEVAVEVRHRAWFEPQQAQVLNKALIEAGAGRVTFDSRPVYNSAAPEAILAQEKKPDVPLVTEAVGDFVLVRYISSPIPEENEAYLPDWVGRVAAWLREGKRVYFFAHCPIESHSPHIARDFYHRVRAVQPDLAPLPWDLLPPDPQVPQQLGLF
ncbi:MAG: DUF72 domain-containing protein [Anaerolinea sp.]|nr:DUF72 domain-containing protein [Anaerolinea sp.]